VGLMLEDEIAELKKSLSAVLENKDKNDADAAVAVAIDNIASYVETIAKNLERY
jgi:hypothetical protein